jgi:uncharacterized protein YndB with AHSA1/START domain
MQATNHSEKELFFIREFDAPRELVFEVWTQSEHLSKWYGPDGFTITTEPMEAKTGGSWRFTMHGPDGRNYLNNIHFTEVVKPEKITYRQTGEEDTADISFETRIYFEAVGSKTRLTMNMIFETAAELQRVAREFGAIEGAEQHLNRVNLYIQSL